MARWPTEHDAGVQWCAVVYGNGHRAGRVTDGASPALGRALILHGSDATRRSAVRAALHAMLDAGNVKLLVSSRQAEVAKCLADPRVVLAVVIDEPAIRRTLSSLAPSLPIVWVTEREAAATLADRVRVRLDALAALRTPREHPRESPS